MTKTNAETSASPNREKTALIIANNGGDYLLGLKDKQSKLHKWAQQKLAHVPDELKSEASFFITSLEKEDRSAFQLGQAIRGH